MKDDHDSYIMLVLSREEIIDQLERMDMLEHFENEDHATWDIAEWGYAVRKLADAIWEAWTI